MIAVGDRVRVYLDEKFGSLQGSYEGRVIRMQPYSEHRSFYWVEFDDDTQRALGMREISVLNPKNIEKIVDAAN